MNIKNGMLLMTRIPYVQAVSMSLLRSPGLLMDTAFCAGNLHQAQCPDVPIIRTLSK